MSEFTEITGIEGQSYFSFFHNEKEYFIWSWLADGGPEVYAVCLSEPRKLSSGAYVPNNLLSQSASKTIVDNAGGTKLFMQNVFIPRVVSYLVENGGEVPEGFPVDANHMEQFNWIVENALQYANGKVSLLDF